MKKCLGNKELIFNGDPSKKIRYGEKEFLYAVDLIAKDIEKKYGEKKDKIGLIGVARGGLPLLVTLSHRLNIRKISVIQVKMTNSDKQWDYGNLEVVNEFIQDDVDEFIIIEDIVSKGRSVNVVIDELTKKNKKALEIYSLIMNNVMNELSLKNDEININYVNLILPTQWVNFFWENGYIK